ncbi:hypothetical protein JKG47_06155 [Acidithiobacillus sp. MC6.1]|nr:hypothetical protein [Acidithiobacillus sp. MC6.1]
MIGEAHGMFPTTTVSPARLRMCQPTQRPTYRTGEWIVTPWGRCRVTGRFGQRHQDVLEAFAWCAEASRKTDDGGMEILIDPAAVRRSLSESGYSLERLRSLIDDLMSVAIELKVTNGMWALGGLLDHVVESSATKRDPLTNGVRHLWRVRLGTVFVQLLKKDIPLYHDPAPIARLQSGVSQAVARHVLTHSSQPNGGWTLDGLIAAVCGDLDAISLRHRRRELRIDSRMLAEIGIVIDGDRVFRNTKACSTGPIEPEKPQKRAAPARRRAAPARKNGKTCSTGPALQHSSECFRADVTAAPDGAASLSATLPPAPSAPTPQGVESPAGEEFSTTAPSPAGCIHPHRGSPRKRRGGGAENQNQNQFDLFPGGSGVA